MYDKAVMEDSWLLNYVSNWFVTHQQTKLWDNDDDYCDSDRLIEWYKSYRF